jgi:adhesin/invasin
MKAVRNAKFSIAILALAALAACGDDGDVTNVVTTTPTSLSITTGTNNQTGVVGTALGTPLSVKVIDQNGAAVAGATVTWAVSNNGGTLGSATSTTDANGIATMTWTLPNAAGSYTVIASIANGQSVTFNATATATTAATLSIVSGNNQSVGHGTATQAFVVKVVDQFGNPVTGAPITWATTGGGTLSATSGTTDATGQAQVTLTTSSTAGPFTVTASSGTLTAVTFNGTGT